MKMPLQFAAAGYHTAVLHYAVGENARDALPMRQLAQAIGLVRQHAEQWNILPDQIALCGFSAGGHLALSGAVWEIPGMADQPRPTPCCWHTRWSPPGNTPTGAALCS